MRKSAIVALAATMTVSAIASAQQTIYDSSQVAIREIISGHMCKGKDILKFGAITPGAAGRFERAGSPVADYAVGYGTILIEHRSIPVLIAASEHCLCSVSTWR